MMTILIAVEVLEASCIHCQSGVNAKLGHCPAYLHGRAGIRPRLWLDLTDESKLAGMPEGGRRVCKTVKMQQVAMSKEESGAEEVKAEVNGRTEGASDQVGPGWASRSKACTACFPPAHFCASPAQWR